MVRRVNYLPSSRLVLAVFCATLCGVSASAQSTDSLRSSSKAGSPFIAAPSFALAANPTSVAVGDLKGDGKLDLVTTRQNSGNVTVLLGSGNGSFAAGVEYAAGTRIGNALLADLNGDGKLDIAVTDLATGDVDVLLGNGDGTFRKPAVYKAIANPLTLALGNFRGTEKTDLAVASAAGVSILLNDGTGRFTASSPVSVSGKPASLVASDLRGAGHDDLIVGKQDGTVTALLGDGAGRFTALSPLAAGSSAVSAIVAGDFNGDGKPDLAIAQPGSDTVTVLLGRGDDTFQTGVPYAVGNGPVVLLAAGLRGNGASDLVTVNRSANTFSVLLGNGDGTFRAAQDFVAGNAPVSIAAGDFNTDGHADLAIVNFQDSTLTVPLGRGDGSFIAARSYKSGLESKAIAAGDLNGDGRTDLVVANFCGSDSACADKGTATVFLANADSSYREGSTLSLGSGPVAIALADLKGDKKLDLVAANRSDKTLEVLPGNGDGTFGDPVTYPLAAYPRALFAGDFNGDGKIDLAIASDCGQSACPQPGTLEIWLGRGNLSLASSATYTVGYSPVSIAAGDLRSTGHLDLAVANTCGEDSACKSNGTATLLSGDGTGKFTPGREVAIGSAPSSIAIGNLTGSGLDLAVAQRGSNQIAVLHADGKGGFGAPTTYAAGSEPSALAIADFNGDGRQDVAAANFQSSTVSVLFGNGSGSLAPAVSYAVGAGPEGLVAVKSGKTGPSSLVTANGNSGSTPVGTDITALFNPLVQGASTTSLGAPNPAAATVDQQVVLTATVTGGGTTPTGNVVFAIDDGGGNFTALSDCGGASGLLLTGAGTAICTTQLLPVGSPVNVQAQYLGDTNYSTSASADQSVTVSQANSLVTLSPTVVPTPVVDQPVTFTATVSVAPPATMAGDVVAFTGAVSFTDGGNPITGCSAISLTNNSAAGTASASCTTSSLIAASAGSPHSIGANYSGDSNYDAGSAGTPQPIGVDTPTVGAPTAAPSAPGVNQQVTLSATAAPANGYPVTVPFAGTMSFTSGSTTLCASAPVNATTGAASCQTSSLPGGSDSITAKYVAGSDPNYASSSTSPALSLTVTAENTTTTLASAPATSTVDQQVVFTATVAPASGTATVAIAGNVAFKNSGTIVPGCSSSPVSYVAAATAYQATCTTSALNATSASNPNAITAVYTPTGTSYSGSTSATLNQTVNPATTTTTVTANPSSPTVNNPVLFTATVTIPANAAVTPAGTVAFTDNATTITGCGAEGLTVVSAAAGTYAATCNLTSLSSGGHTIVATYTGDANYSGSFGNLNLSLGSASSTTAVTSSANPSTVNQSVTFTVSVHGGTTVKVSGTATVIADTTNQLGQCTVANWSNTTGIATCSVSTSSLALGSHTIAASYSGDSNYNSSSGNLSSSQVVNQASTTTALASSLNPSTVNKSVTFMATVGFPSGGTALGGTVAFTDQPSGGSAAAIPGCSAVAPSTAGVAACTDLSLTAAGSPHTIKASYSGDTNFNSSSATLAPNQTVSAATITSLTVTSSPNPSSFHQSVAILATIVAPSGGVALSGNVTFTDSVTGAAIPNCSNVSLNANSVAQCNTSALANGSHTITATYGNDLNFATISNTTSQSVGSAATSVAIGLSPNPSVFGGPVTIVATVSSPSQGSALFNGAMTILLNGNPIAGCPAAAVNGSSGQAPVCSTTVMPVGNNTVTASYNGDTSFGSSSSSAVETVNINSNTSIVLASAPSSPASIEANVPVTLKASINFGSAGVVPLTGNMVFTDNSSTTLCTIPASKFSPAGVATCKVAALSDGSNLVLASYTGDTNFLAPQSNSVSLTVQDFSLTVAPVPSNSLGVTITQGTTSANDPYAEQAISVVPASATGSYMGTLSLMCTASPSTGAPACNLASQTVAVVASGVQASVGISLDATNALPGTYTFTVTATDAVNLTHTFMFPVTVRSQATPLVLISGASTNNTASVSFVLPAGVSITSLNCFQVVGPEITSPLTPSQLSIGCAFNPATIASAAATQTVPVVVTISTGTTTAMAQPAGDSTLMVAGVFALPLFGFLGLLGGRKSIRSAFLRMLAIVAVSIAAWQVMGCGGSFHGSGTTNGGKTPPGVYEILVDGTGSDGNTYQAVIKLTVTL